MHEDLPLVFCMQPACFDNVVLDFVSACCKPQAQIPQAVSQGMQQVMQQGMQQGMQQAVPQMMIPVSGMQQQAPAQMQYQGVVGMQAQQQQAYQQVPVQNYQQGMYTHSQTYTIVRLGANGGRVVMVASRPVLYMYVYFFSSAPAK